MNLQENILRMKEMMGIISEGTDERTKVFITGKDLSDFTKQIREKTEDKKIDLSTIVFNIDKFKLEYYEDESKPVIKRLSLAYNSPGSKNCESCVSIEKNNKGNFEIVKDGKFDTDRFYNLYAIKK